MENRRLTAKKVSVPEVVNGTFVQRPGFESNYVISNFGRKLSRVRIMGIVVDKFKSEDGNYAVITLDDSFETIRAKAFVNTKIFDDIKKGQLVDLMGKLRQYNGEIYVMPESVRPVEPNWEILRMIELIKIYNRQKELIERVKKLEEGTADAQELERVALKFMSKSQFEEILEMQKLKEAKFEEKIESNIMSKEKVLELIKKLDKGEGTDYIDLITKSELPEKEVDKAIEELLENGICFEPRPGKIKVL